MSAKENSLVLAVICWMAIIVLVAMLLGYRACENEHDRVMECVKAGHSVPECKDAFKPGPKP